MTCVQICLCVNHCGLWWKLVIQNIMSRNEHTNTPLFLHFQLGDGSKKCIRYWPDDEISHEHIHVKYIQSESCPYYTRRELSVTNTKVSLIIDWFCWIFLNNSSEVLKHYVKAFFCIHCFDTKIIALQWWCYILKMRYGPFMMSFWLIIQLKFNIKNYIFIM